MFDNINEKLKGLAFIHLFLDIPLAIIGGTLCLNKGYFYIGISLMILGTIAALTISWICYGIGECVENTIKNRNFNKSSVQSRSDSEAKKQIFSAFKSPSTKESSTIRLCPFCGETVKSDTCDMCGKKNDLFK